MGTGTEHAKWLRGVLVAERDRRGWSLSRTAREIARELRAAGADKPGLTKQSLEKWEDFTVQPKIDRFAAWARALGLRLEVDLVQRDEPTVVARLPADVADLAREIALLDDGDRAYLVETVARLKRHK